jgi:hypothetical protein
MMPKRRHRPYLKSPLWLVYAQREEGVKFYGLYVEQHAANAVAARTLGAHVQQLVVADMGAENPLDVLALIA